MLTMCLLFPALNQALEAQTASLEAAKTRVGELDSLLGKKDATIAESKRLLQEAKDEYHEQLEVRFSLLTLKMKYVCI